MPGIFLGLKFQACIFFLGLQYEALSDPPRHVYFEYPPWGLSNKRNLQRKGSAENDPYN